jgi:alkylation response protein AidB-like acyl-CoA dehydrogenase
MKKVTGPDILDTDIREKLSTRNIYSVFNEFVIPLITKDEQEFLIELEDFLIKEVEPKINLNNDVYELFPILGKGNYIQRLNKYGDSEQYGMRYEILLAMACSIVDPELDLARVVSGVIFGNPLFQFGSNERLTEITADVMSGKKIGCICITERTRGSDAVNMRTKIEPSGDNLILSGEKVYTTNGPVGDYFIVYGVSNIANPRATMYQVIAEREFEGVETHRLGIPSIPRVQVGQIIFDDVKIPKTNVLGGAGQGYKNLFAGLVAERDAIIGSSLGISWLTAVTALIYTNFREQFGQPIYNFQAVSFPITKLFTELMAATEFGFRSASEYRKTLDYSDSKFIKYNAAFSSGTKFHASNLAQRLSYEVQQLCGGIAFTDNLKIDAALEVSKVQEIIGGARNIQLYLVSKAIKDIVGRVVL